MRNFNAIITNPPYAGSLHLDIFDRLLDNLEVCQGQTTGQMVIVEPSTWLINVRRNGKAKKYDAIKKRIEGHVKSVKIENLNKDFNTGLYVPFSITTIDFSKTYDTIEFECCGEKKIVDSIYDCNLIGSYDTIWSILNKVLAYGDMMDKHTTNKDEGTWMWYAKYDDITPFGIDPVEGVANLGRGGASKNDNNYVKLAMGEYGYNYVQTSFHRIVGITQSVPKKLKPGSNYTNPKYSDTNADCVYGTKQELENWKHFIFNNKLPLFINIVLTIDQNNNSKEFLPWLVDRQYTDEEIYAKFNLTEDEIALIDATLKKFERNSPWFKRYMCGEDCEKTVNENRRRNKKKQTMKNNNENPLNFNTNPDPFWNAKPLYGKPDLQKLHEQKEQEKLERNAETEQCWKLVKECGEVMRQTLTDYPDDLEEIKKTARFLVIWLRKRVQERNFKRLSKFDVQRMLEAEIKAVRRELHFICQ